MLADQKGEHASPCLVCMCSLCDLLCLVRSLAEGKLRIAIDPNQPTISAASHRRSFAALSKAMHDGFATKRKM
jgi:hypothetical protein